MEDTQSDSEIRTTLSAVFEHWVPPAITAVLGLVVGLALSAYDSNISDNRYFLEKRIETADGIAKEFSVYVVNWGRLVALRRHFDTKDSPPSEEEKENFKRTVHNRNDARDRLFSAFDSAHLYYSDDTSELITEFRQWDIKQSKLTIEQLPDIQHWRNWQKKILRKLHGEVAK